MDVLDRLLDKGLVLNADLVISVAGVPLVAGNLRALLASVETMERFGLLRLDEPGAARWPNKEGTG